MLRESIFFLLAPALLALAQPTVTRNDKQVLIKGNSYVVNLQASKNYNFNFKDSKSAMSIFSSLIWYHGRNENEAEHFYKDHSEANWKVFDIKENTLADGKEVVLQSKNNEFSLTRTLRTFNDLDALYLKYELFALESRMYPAINFPIMRIIKDVDSVSYNLNGTDAEFVTEAKPKADGLAKAHLLFLHSSKMGKTIIVVPNLNAPLDNGEPVGLAATFGDAKWCKTLNFTHLYTPFITFRQAGDKQVFEVAMAVMDGAVLSDEMKKQAVAIASRLNFTAPRFTMHGIGEDQTQPSSMAGMLCKQDGLSIWQEISAKRVHPETALPTASLPAIRLSAARSEAESVQLAFHCEEGTVLDAVKASPLACPGKPSIPADKVELEFLEYQTMNNKFTSQGMSTQVGDKLLPLELPCAVKAKNQVIWLTVTCPKSQPAGVYKGTLTIKWHNSKAGQATLPVEYKVWNFELPEAPAYTAYGLLWDTPKEMRRVTMELAAKYRHTTTVIYGSSRHTLKNIKDGKFIDTQEYDLAKYAVDSLHFHSINLPVFMGAWNWRPGKPLHFGNLKLEAPEFEDKFRSYLTLLYNEAKERGYADKLNAYMWDEVTQPMYEAVAKTARICREVAPEIKILTVGAPDEAVIENSDIIVTGGPACWWGNLAKSRIDKARANGKEFWVYLNDVSPENPLLYPRIIPWRSWGMGVSGFLYWTMDYRWNGNFNTHGLNWKLYPPVKKGVPVASLRLAAMRDGIDDYDYLELARKKLPAAQWSKVEGIIAPLANPDTKPDLDPVRLVKARETIGELLHKAH